MIWGPYTKSAPASRLYSRSGSWLTRTIGARITLSR